MDKTEDMAQRGLLKRGNMVYENNEIPFLLASKLNRPQSLYQSVPRPRLLAQLHEGLKHKAAFVTAPAGYGKTTLLSDWTRHLEVPVGWLSLDSKDNDLIRFWNYVTKAIEQARGVTDSLHTTSAALSPGQYEPFIVALLNELNELNETLVLILDDWHVIHNADILESVSYFLEYLPSSVHLCFSSRSIHGFLKSRWISRNWIHEITTQQLCFDLQETLKLFQDVEKKELQREQIEGILYQTEGWVTGIKLISLSLRADEWAGSSKHIQSSHERVESFLLEEVFESLGEPLRQFLLNVSILQRMNGPLCQAVAGEDGAVKLAELAKLNLFLIPLDEEKNWFRLHHLFGEFLLKHQQRLDSAKTAALFRAAAAWCESQEMHEEAVDYYLAGACYTDVIRLLEQMRSLMIRREFSTMRDWLSAIPEELLMRHPYLYFSYIFSLLWAQELELAERYLQLAEQHYDASSASWTKEENHRYLGYLYYVRNFKATQYDMDMIKGLEYIRLSLQYSPTGTDLIFASPHMPLAPSIYRSYNGKRGQHLPRGLSDTFFLSMIEFMKPMGLQDSVVVCYGELLYERNELKQAEDYFRLGLQGRSQAHYQPEKVYVPASLFLSRISQSRQDISQAEKWLEEAYRRALEDEAKAALILLDLEMARMRLNAGDLSAADEWKNRYRLAADDPVSVYQLFVYIFLVSVLMESGNAREAWALSERLLPIAVKGHRPMDALDIQVLQAMMLRLEGKSQQALLKLEEALKFAEPDDYIRVFVDKGSRVAELLTDYVQHRQRGSIRDKNAPSLSYVRRILSGFGGTAESPEQGKVTLENLLTPREYAVFRYMEEGMDNQAIVAALGFGMGTLKAHINRIYSKLQAKNRVEAIKRGKEIQG